MALMEDYPFVITIYSFGNYLLIVIPTLLPCEAEVHVVQEKAANFSPTPGLPHTFLPAALIYKFVGPRWNLRQLPSCHLNKPDLS